MKHTAIWASEVIIVFFTFQNDLQKQNWDQQDTKLI